MRFKPCIDFFRKGKKLLLTGRGKKRIEKIKITGTKIPYFFKLTLNFPNEEEQSIIQPTEDDPITEYQIGGKVFGFPFMPKRNPKKQEKYRSIEEIIKTYLEEQLNKRGINYPLDKYDIFDENECFGGVPDGEERNEKGETISILEIKTITEQKHKKKIHHIFQSPPLKYQLQLGLYLYLRGIDTGYICMCFLNPDNGQDLKTIRLNTKLKSYKDSSLTLSGTIDSWLSSIGSCKYEYTILDALCNDFLNDNEVILFKIKIDMEKYEKMLMKIKDGFLKNKSASPEILEDELKKLLLKNKKG